MKQFKTDIIIFLAIVSLSLVALVLTAGESMVDIQLHDTYFVIDKISMTFLIIGPLTFLIFLVRALSKGFKTKGPNLGLILGLMFLAFITFYAVQLQKGYLNQIIKVDDEGIPDRGQFIADAKHNINLTWRLLVVWGVGLFLVIARTFKIWKKKKVI